MTGRLFDPAPETDAPGGPPVGLDRLRVLAAGAMGTVLLTYAMLVPVAAAAVRSGGRGLTLDGAFAAAVPLWLAAHQVPLAIQGQPLSVLPLLPTAAVVGLVAFGATWAIRRLGGRPTDAGAVLATVAGGHAAMAVLGSALLPPEVAAGPWSAMLAAGAVTAAGVGLGALRTAAGALRTLLMAWPGRPAWLLPGLSAARVGGVGLLAVGAGVLTVGLALGAAAVQAAYERLAPDAAAAVGVTLLACAYLPNAVVAALSWALAPGLGVGPAAASPFGAVASAEPSSFPLLAAVPTAAPTAAVAVLVLPATVGVLVGRTAARACGDGAPTKLRICAALAATAGGAVATGLLALLAGGRLATGAYDPVRLPAGLLVLAVLLEVGVPATLAALVAGPVPGAGRSGAQGERQACPSAEGTDGAKAGAMGDGARRVDGTAPAAAPADGRAGSPRVSAGCGAEPAGAEGAPDPRRHPVGSGDRADPPPADRVATEAKPAPAAEDRADSPLAGPAADGAAARPPAPAPAPAPAAPAVSAPRRPATVAELVAQRAWEAAESARLAAERRDEL